MRLTLSELCEKLSYGELSNLAMANEGDGTIIEAARPKIVLHLNEALLDLHSKYVLNEKVLILQVDSDIPEYKLLRRYAASYEPGEDEINEPIRYIRDSTSDPFLEDVIKVLSVFDSCARKLPLNDEGDPHSIFTPKYNVIQVPCSCTERQLAVSFQARHPKVLNYFEEEIEIPDILLGALTSYIAYKVFSHVNSQDSSLKAQEYLATYAARCADVTEKDLVNSSVSTSNTRFTQRGWV